MRSLSEIETVSKRASKAAGFPWGIAEEIGKNIRLLEMFGLPGIKNLNNYYKRRNKENFENLNLINADNRLINSKFCPIKVGINFLDQIRILENLNKINFEKMAYPLLFLPFLSRSSEIIGKRLLVKFDKDEFLLNFNNNIYSNFLKKEVVELADNVSISFVNNKDSFLESEWKELYKLSENTFVEETDSLKKIGAGAGLTDND
jgi:hypothetical protein